MRHPAYNLRTNKAVDRLTLIAQIRVLLDEERDATFYSLSGPFLEDMKIAHSVLPEMGLVSIEANEQTYKRQSFHLFTSKLKLVRSSFEDFVIHSYEPGKQDFFWLDFTDLTPATFQSFRQVLVRAPHKSLVRMTLRAEPDRSLTEVARYLTDEQKSIVEQQINAAFEDKFGAILSHDAKRTPISTEAEFARTVQLMVRRIASDALDNGAERDFLHMSSARYDDGSQMLSVTGVIAERDKIPELQAAFKRKGLPLEEDTWTEPVQIGIPNLSIMERHVLDRHLPKVDKETLGVLLLKKLKYHIDNGENRSKQALRQYARYYREYPNFVRASL
jgi:hypothetical protein